jgi:hypothetical protein
MLFSRSFQIGVALLLGMLLLGHSVLPPGDAVERVRAFTRPIEFDYISWTGNALGVKLGQSALNLPHYLSDQQQQQIVLHYLDLVRRIQEAEDHIKTIYADPNIPNPQIASSLTRQRLAELSAQRNQMAPLVETILQYQVSMVLADLGLSFGGQPLPPVLYRTTPVPLALIVSPRDTIRQDANISLKADLTLEQIVSLEEQVERDLNVSSLVVNIGGIGIYPTMVMQTTDLNWLVEVVAHEWTHNFLTLRPLGLSYQNSAELRTMNETTASIAGKEIGRAVMEKYYPDLLPPPEEEKPSPPEAAKPSEPPAFDFRAEMHLTRVTVDQLLAEGKVEEAEAFMEQRRQFFWENGYRIRRLNQAYFAFYGAYADEPGGAAGEDPVGTAVRALRAQSPSLAAFLHRISWMSSFEQLQRAVNPK